MLNKGRSVQDKSIPNVLPRRSWRGHAYWAFRFLTSFHLCIFGKKPYARGRRAKRLGGEWGPCGSWSQVEERLGQAPSVMGWNADAAFPAAPLSVMSGLLLTTSVIKTNKKGIWETFPSDTDMCVPSESFSPWVAVFWLQGGERRKWWHNSRPVLFSNYKALNWCFIFQ